MSRPRKTYEGDLRALEEVVVEILSEHEAARERGQRHLPLLESTVRAGLNRKDGHPGRLTGTVLARLVERGLIKITPIMGDAFVEYAPLTLRKENEG